MTADITIAIQTYFMDNWTSTDIQYEDTELNYDGMTKFIGLVYNPIDNSTYAFDGTSCGRIKSDAIQRVRCYAKNPIQSYKLADEVKVFLNGLQLGGISFGVGVDGTALNLDNGWVEVVVQFNLTKFN